MDTEATSELAEALAEARTPVEPCALPSASLGVRVSTAPWLRRTVPAAVVVRRAERHAHSLWSHDAAERERARAAMEAVVGGTERAGEVGTLAREHVVEGKVKEALYWQPWAAPKLDERSATRLRDAVESARGVLFSGFHAGPYFLCASAIAAVGRTAYSVVGPYLFQPVEPGTWGRRMARRRNGARARNERLIRSAGSFGVLKTLLEERETVVVFFSVPGTCETRFLGKPVMLASGSARLAMQSGALVLPVRARRVGSDVWMDVGEPLDPRQFSSWLALHEALAGQHERFSLELPAALEDPNREGSWEHRATAHGWSL